MNNFANANFFRRMALALLALPCFVGGGHFRQMQPMTMRKSAKCARFGLLPFSTLIGLKGIITENPTR